ncbi:MAG: DnaJ domain-containing protein [Candidatus Brachytrichaceae bacterium NZ_4S206]
MIEGVDLTKLPLSPLEGFVVSRIDGQASVAVLGDLTNLDEDQVTGIVARLMELGVAEWARESVSLPRATGRSSTRTPTTVVVPESIRPPPAAARVNVPRPIRSAAPPKPEESPTRSVYRAKQNVEERVDISRRGTSSEPLASHTGTLKPAGELEELEPLAAALGYLEELEFEAADRVATAPPEPAPPESSRPPPPKSFPPESARAAVGSGSMAPPPLAPSAPEPVAEPASSRPPSVAPPAQEAADPDELDLDPERQKRIDELYVALDLLDHYEILGVARDADRDAIRTAYFQLSKVFHPDTMFRKRLGPYKAKMEAVFRRLTEAYEVLGKKRARQDYDRYLALQDQTRAVEAALGGAPAPEPSAPPRRSSVPPRRARTSNGRSSAPPSPPSAPPVTAPAAPSTPPKAPPAAPSAAPPPTATETQRRMSDEGRARARELMAKKLRGAVKPAAAPTPPAAPESTAKGDREQVLRGLTSSLRATASHTGGVDMAQRHVLNARRAERDGDLAEATRELRLAMSLAPDRVDVAQDHARVSAALAASLAASYEERALYEERHGKWAAAAISWSKVVEGRPDDVRAARSAAEALVAAKGDLHRAKELAQKAVELDPKDVHALRALAGVYIAAGLPLNARRVLQQASALDPSDKMVENLLRELER